MIQIFGIKSFDTLSDYFASSIVDVAYIEPYKGDSAIITLDNSIDVQNQNDRKWLSKILEESFIDAGEKEISYTIFGEVDEAISESEIDFYDLFISNISVWMDGGSVAFHCYSGDSKDFQIEVVQKVALEKKEELRWPGALYLSETLVTVRSELEAKIIIGLKTAEFSSSFDYTKNDLGLLQQSVKYLESIEFLENALQTGRIVEI